ncbi:MAG: putative lipid II flippase FtsW [Deltaproteobacteria bacterium]|nr:putative lipid II flippase FtsW [Deltaproteobacteria bacterium]
MVLVGLGIVMVYSASFVIAGQRFGDSYHFLKKQAMAAALGIGLMFFLARLNYRRLKILAIPLLLVSLVLLGVLILPGMRHEVGGSARWLRLSFFSFQPAELAKLALVIYLAYSLARKEGRMQSFSAGFLPYVIILGIFFALVLKQPDFGTGIIFGAIVFIMLFVAGTRILFLGSTILATLPVILFLALRADYRKERLFSFLNPWSDPGNAGFQIIQSFLAFGAGKIFGVGLGEGRQKLFYLPEVHTDFILAVIGEELGLVGVTVVIGLFVFLIIRGFQICFRASDLFGTYLALGIATLMAVQTLLNMGVVMGLLPTKGSTLPFISYGGTSLMINLMAMGILLNISSQGLRTADENHDSRWRDGRTSFSGPGRG